MGTEAATFSELFAEVLHPSPHDGETAETGADLYAALSISFEESFRGVERQVLVTRQVPVPPAPGAGRIRTPEGRCAHCHATGQVRWARGHMVFAKACAACGGTGRQRFQRCDGVRAHGRPCAAKRSRSVPAGVVDGARLRIPESGHAGRAADGTAISM